jgi:cytochrome c peroxidase
MDGKRLFERETFGGNGRTCLTCHSIETGTVSPADALSRLQANPHDPLFVFDGSDDGHGNGVTRMRDHATVLIEIPLPPNVTMGDAPSARSVILRRGIPTTLNTPALDPVLMLDGREPDLQTQALHAIQQHDQPTQAPSAADIKRIAEFELTDDFFSSPALRAFARGGPPPQLPLGNTDSEKRGRRFFIDGSPFAPGANGAGACAVCHSGPMLNHTNQFLPLPDPPGTRFLTIGVSEANFLQNPVRPYIFHNLDGSQVTILSSDPGRALITGHIDGNPAVNGAPFFTSLNAFKISSLWGVKNTAPYFHNNSANTLEDVVNFYGDFVFPPFGLSLSPQDRIDIVAYLKLL